MTLRLPIARLIRARPRIRATRLQPATRTSFTPTLATTRALAPSYFRIFSTTPLQKSTAPMAAETDTPPTTSQPPTPDSLTTTIQSRLKTAHIQIIDQSGGCGQAFAAVIVSDDFEGKSLLQRNRLVNGILKEEIAGIHAWSCRCFTVGQWEKEKEREGQ